MGYSTTKIPFMLIDDSKIEIESASDIKYFNFNKISDFQNLRGGFSETDKSPKTFIFENPKTKEFAEFKFIE